MGVFLNRLKSLKSFVKVSSAFGTMTTERNKGNIEQAYEAAVEGLKLLRDADVYVLGFPEGVLIFGFTSEVERLGSKLNKPGASERDVENSLAFLKRKKKSGDDLEWIEYFEKKLDFLKKQKENPE